MHFKTQLYPHKTWIRSSSHSVWLLQLSSLSPSKSIILSTQMCEWQRSKLYHRIARYNIFECALIFLVPSAWRCPASHSTPDLLLSSRLPGVLLVFTIFSRAVQNFKLSCPLTPRNFQFISSSRHWNWAKMLNIINGLPHFPQWPAALNAASKYCSR